MSGHNSSPSPKNTEQILAQAEGDPTLRQELTLADYQQEQLEHLYGVESIDHLGAIGRAVIFSDERKELTGDTSKSWPSKRDQEAAVTIHPYRAKQYDEEGRFQGYVPALEFKRALAQGEPEAEPRLPGFETTLPTQQEVIPVGVIGDDGKLRPNRHFTETDVAILEGMMMELGQMKDIGLLPDLDDSYASIKGSEPVVSLEPHK